MPSSTPGGQLEVDRLAAAERDALAAERRRIVERHVEAIGDVGALLRRRAAAAEAAEAAAARRRRRAAEQAFEHVAEIGRLAAAELEARHWGRESRRRRRRRRPPPPPPKPKGIAGLPSPSISPRSILRALVLVGQQVIGLRDLGEALGRLGIVLVAVGVQLLGELAIGLLDVGLARAARHAQRRIEIGHAS